MKMLQRAGLIVIVILSTGYAIENTVFIDDVFPYRLACKPEWNEVKKNDTLLLLENTTPGIKLRFQLKKYEIDTSFFDTEEMDWSRWQFVTNTGIADGFGTLWFSDSGETVKIGSLPAFRYFAFFKMAAGTDTVWLAQYDSWTEKDGSGYLVSLFGDTTTMVSYFSQYKAVVDSLRIEASATSLSAVALSRHLSVNNQAALHVNGFHDLLGRPQKFLTGRVPSVLVGKGRKRCVIRQ